MVMKVKINEVSEANSFKGFSFKKLVSKNKDNIKAIIMFVAGYSYLVGFDYKIFIAGLVAILGKCAIDSLDFYLSSVELE
jgi:hypothetical protein